MSEGEPDRVEPEPFVGGAAIKGVPGNRQADPGKLSPDLVSKSSREREAQLKFGPLVLLRPLEDIAAEYLASVHRGGAFAAFGQTGHSGPLGAEGPEGAFDAAASALDGRGL